MIPANLSTGSLPQLYDRQGWNFQDNLDEKYGSVVRFTGMFRVSRTLRLSLSYAHDLRKRQKEALYVFDPKALHHIIVKDQNVFERASFAVS